MAAPQITQLPPPPLRSDAPSDFAIKADTFLQALPNFVTEANAQANFTDQRATDAETAATNAATSETNAANSATAAQAAADNAAASANFKGEWSSLSGTLSKPASVAHSGKVWLLLNDLSDVTTSEPGVSPDWQLAAAVEVSDILPSGATAGQIIQFDGLAWSPASLPDSAAPSLHWYISATDASWTFTVPQGVTTLRAYAVGKGGDGLAYVTHSDPGYYSIAPGGGGGGMAFGDIPVTPGETLQLSITAGVAEVIRGSTALLTANPGVTATATSTSPAGGTASIDASVLNGGAFTGGSGHSGGGGGSAASPLGNGYPGGRGGGGGGIGGAGDIGGGGAGGAAMSHGGGAGGAATDSLPGPGRSLEKIFTDPLISACTGFGGSWLNQSTRGDCKATHGEYGGGGGGFFIYDVYAYAGNGGYCGGGGGACDYTTVTGRIPVAYGGSGGAFGGGGGAYARAYGAGCSGAKAVAGDGGVGAGGGGACAITINSSYTPFATAGKGGPAAIILYY